MAALAAFAAATPTHAADTGASNLMTQNSSSADRPQQENAARDITIAGFVRYGRINPDVGVVGLSVTNSGESNHLISGVDSSICNNLVARNLDQETSEHIDELFTHLTIPHHTTMVFSPGGYHLLCRGIRPNIAVGTEVPFTFHFLGGTSRTVNFRMIPPDDDQAVPASQPVDADRTASNASP